MAVFRVKDFSAGIAPFDEVGQSVVDSEGTFFQNLPPYASAHVTSVNVSIPGAPALMKWMTPAQASFVYGYHFDGFSGNKPTITQFIGHSASIVAIGSSTIVAERGDGGLAEYQNRMYFSDPQGEKLRFWDFASGNVVTACSASGIYGPLFKHRERLFVGKHGFNTDGTEVRAHIDIIQGDSELAEAIAFDRGERVNAISNLNEFLVIGLSSRRIVVWDGISLSPDYEFNISDVPRSMYNLNNILYIWAPPHLYAMQSFGSQPEKVMTIPSRFRGNSQIGRMDAVPGSLTGWNGILYFTNHRSFGDASNKYGLWAFGNVHTAGPNALSFIEDPGTGASFTLQGAGALAVNGDQLFVYMQEENDETIFTYCADNDYSDFELQIAAQDFGLPEAEKQVLKVGLTTLPLPSGASVGVQFREEYSSTAFTPIELNVVDEVYRYGVLNNAPYARKLEFKITANASGASSPTITSFMAHVEVSVPSEFGQ